MSQGVLGNKMCSYSLTMPVRGWHPFDSNLGFKKEMKWEKWAVATNKRDWYRRRREEGKKHDDWKSHKEYTINHLPKTFCNTCKSLYKYTHILGMTVFPSGLTVLSTNHRSRNKDPQYRHEKPSFALLVRVVQETSKTLHPGVVAPHTWRWKVHSCCWRHIHFRLKAQRNLS